ncbi:MAG: HEAT repeat domain-containing protein [Deltaproteobacteria bacterium]|nr:HEAT repeat domain-containing protein [Deltaproteobacteria bacterium]
MNTTISSIVHVGEADGKVTGIEIHNLHLAAREPQVPSEESVKAYLTKVAALGTFPEREDLSPAPGPKDPADAQGDASLKSFEMLQTLWATPFFVHPFGQVASLSREAVSAIREVIEVPDPSAPGVIVMAEAGAGKTGVLKRIRYDFAREALLRLDNLQTEGQAGGRHRLLGLPVPIFMELRNLQGDVPALLASAYSRLAPTPIDVAEANKLVEQYNCLLLFDGLDDIRSDSPIGGFQALRRFVDCHPAVRCVFSCRLGAYGGQLGRVILLELDLLGVDQVQRILGVGEFAGLPVPLQELARSRLMLEIMLLRKRTGDHPESKGQLMQELIRNRCGLDDPGAPALRTTEGLLESLAYSMQRDHSFRFSERQVMEKITAYLKEWREDIGWRDALDRLEQSRAFVTDERRSRWYFESRNTQSYFSAAAMTKDNELMTKGLENASDPKWTETFEILAGILPDPSRLLFELVDRDARVAARCFGVARPPIPESFQDALLDELVDALGRETAEGREEIARFLSRYPLRNAEQVLLNALQREWRSGAILAMSQALLPVVEPADPLDDDLEFDLQSKDERDRFKAVVRIWRGYVEGPPVIEAEHHPDLARRWRENGESRLIRIMESRRQSDLVRGVAAVVLGSLGSDSAIDRLLAWWRRGQMTETFGWCVTEALAHIGRSMIEGVRQAAMNAVCRHSAKASGGKTADIPPKEAAAGGRRSSVNTSDAQRELRRAWAFYLLGYLGTGETYSDLLTLALVDPRESAKVRGYAAQALGGLQPKEARQVLQDALARESDLWVVRKVVQALGNVGTPDSVPILENYLRTGRVQVRKSVQRSIANINQRFEVPA